MGGLSMSMRMSMDIHPYGRYTWAWTFGLHDCTIELIQFQWPNMTCVQASEGLFMKMHSFE